MPYVIENLVQYDLTDEESQTLERMGFIFPNPETCGRDQRETTAYVWDRLDLAGSDVFDFFDRVLGRRTFESVGTES